MTQPYIKLNRWEWKEIHNALCNAEAASADLFAVIKDGGASLQAIKDIRTALKPAYDQDDVAFDRQCKHFEQIRALNDFMSMWSLYDEVEVGGFTNQHPYPSAQYLVYDAHWGADSIQQPILGRTWLDLYRAADIAIRKSGDHHHLFIEDFRPASDHSPVLILVTGS